jgi:hypothetical protein
MVERSKGLLNKVLSYIINLIFLGSKNIKSKNYKYYKHKVVLRDKYNLIVFLVC